MSGHEPFDLGCSTYLLVSEFDYKFRILFAEFVNNDNEASLLQEETQAVNTPTPCS